MFLVKIPWWIRLYYPSSFLWKVKTEQKILYLTFDDGPHPKATPFVLDTLRQYKAKATFFNLGKNALLFPELYNRVVAEGHLIGNHTFNHLNGWKTSASSYLEDVKNANSILSTSYFRPPYGRIPIQTAKKLIKLAIMEGSTLQIVMWHVLSGDFDQTLSGQDCISNVVSNAGKGSIVVFHESDKAWPRLEVALPAVLKYYAALGYHFETLEQK